MMSALLWATGLMGQDSLMSFPLTIQRLRAFGERIPQEKVYVHMDNRCYFLGDTIWFKAYTQQTNDGKPSEMSGTLYVELFDQEGYLKERKLVEMNKGQGCGFFATDTTMYGGFYELRAYTRWQLNWGEYEHRHQPTAKRWFFNEAMSHEYFRDYEKLYSRTFPVFERQQIPGAYYLDMTPRPMERESFTKEEKATASVRFYPEGGSLVEGLPCRVAYEAVMTNGQVMDGVLLVGGDSVPVVNRGRGMFTLTPTGGNMPQAVFVDTAGTRVKCSLPKAERDGVILKVTREGNMWVMETRTAGSVPQDSLYLTVMQQGRLRHAWKIGGQVFSLSVSADSLPVGVNQATVSDVSGRVWADRLFFVGREGMDRPTVTMGGDMQGLQPYQKVQLGVQSPKGGCTLSLAVRDAARQHGNFDNGSILTELLLCSEVKGFIPRPGYFFEKDDDAHRNALDLLMMTQGWRRFDWREMAVRGEFEMLHPAERTPVLTGVAHKYEALKKLDPTMYGANYDRHLRETGLADTTGTEESEMKGVSYSIYDDRGLRIFQHKLPSDKGWGEAIGASEGLNRRLVRDGEKLKRELRVHSEFLMEGSSNAVLGDVRTQMGRFRIRMPHFYGACHFHLAASDTTRWSSRDLKKDNHQWICADETKYPEYYIRLSFPYPLFVKPYSLYQQSLVKRPDGDSQEMTEQGAETLKTLLVTSHARKGLSKRMYQKHAVALDGYEAFNLASDAGLMDGWYNSSTALATGVARYFSSDMGINDDYSIIAQLGDQLDFHPLLAQSDLTSESRINPGRVREAGLASYRRTSSGVDNKSGMVGQSGDPVVMQDGLMQIDGENPDKARMEYNYLHNIDSIFVFSSYSPRLEGNSQYKGADVPSVRVQFKRFADHGKRATYRDRYMVLPGYAYLADFYHPDYSTHRPSPEQADYRRTLYWNPNLKLDAEGKAQVQFYNNARTTRLCIEAAGLSPDGTILWNKTE